MENFFCKYIYDIKSKEVTTLRNIFFLLAFIVLIEEITPVAAIIVFYVVFFRIYKKMSLGLYIIFGQIEFALQTIFSSLPWDISSIMQFYVSITRINTFMSIDENQVNYHDEKIQKGSIEIQDGMFYYNNKVIEQFENLMLQDEDSEISKIMEEEEEEEEENRENELEDEEEDDQENKLGEEEVDVDDLTEAQIEEQEKKEPPKSEFNPVFKQETMENNQLRTSLLQQSEEVQLKNSFQNNSEPNKEFSFHLENINISIKSGELVFLIGNLGSGKTTLLRSLFGQTNKGQNSSVQFNGSISYCPQSSFLLTESIKDNIVFFNEFDQ